MAVMDRIACFTARVPMLSHAGAAAALAALRPHLPDCAMKPLAEAAADAASGAPADDADHDRYFAIERVDGPAGAIFLCSVVAAAAAFHSECDAVHAGADADRFSALGAGFVALLAYLAGGRANAPAAPTDIAADIAADRATDAPADAPAEAAAEAAAPVDPVRRWRLGHQLFVVLTQGIVHALYGLETAMEMADDAAAQAALAVAADLLLASAAAFRFTGDFSPAAYRDVIRPSMSPPQIGAGFSGLLSSDHRFLVQVLSRLRPLLATAEIRYPAAHARLTAALRQVYDDHKFVCARFDGAQVPSLRDNAGRHGSGVDQLDRFKRARLRLLRAGSRTPPA